MPEVDAVRFRREVRRLSSRFLSQKLTHALFLAEVRKSAVACGFAVDRRTSRDDRLLDALAWGSGSVHPGELPGRLEPLFLRHAAGEVTGATLATEVQTVLAQIRKPADTPI